MGRLLCLFLCFSCVPLLHSAPRPDDIEALARKAGTLLKDGDYKGAAEAAGQALKLEPENTDLRSARILALTGARELDQALAEVNDTLRLVPTDSRFWTARANIHNLKKNYGLALGDAQQAISFDERDAEAYLSAAWALDGLGRLKLEPQFLAQAAALNPKYARLHGDSLKDGDLARVLSGEEVVPVEQPAAQPSWLYEHREVASVGLALLLVLAVLVPAFFLRKFLFKASPVEEASDKTPAPVTPMVGGYKVVKALASGGMGIVYEGVDTTLDRRVAIKKMRDEIRNDRTERDRFLTEARMVASLHHPNIVEIYEILEDGADVYLVFEYVDGKTLQELLHVRKRLPLREAAWVMQSTAMALEYAHARGMVHRDLKPSNIMVTRELQIKVMDFGVARQASQPLDGVALTNTIVGTPPYMAPEQFEGKVCKGSDVYALGICMYEMVIGQLPFGGEGVGVLLAKMNKTYVPPSRLLEGLPQGFDAVLDKVLEPDPEKRWKSAAEFAAALKDL